MRRRMAQEAPVYDLMLLLDPDVEEARRDKIVADVQELITHHGGDLVDRHDWGVRATAYEIRKRTDQDYHLIQFHATHDALEAIDHTLKITDGVSRFRVIKLRPGTPAVPDLRTASVAAGDPEPGDDD